MQQRPSLSDDFWLPFVSKTAAAAAAKNDHLIFLAPFLNSLRKLFFSFSRLASSSSHNRVVVVAVASIEKKKTGRKSSYLYALTPSFAYAFGHTHTHRHRIFGYFIFLRLLWCRCCSTLWFVLSKCPSFSLCVCVDDETVVCSPNQNTSQTHNTQKH